MTESIDKEKNIINEENKTRKRKWDDPGNSQESSISSEPPQKSSKTPGPADLIKQQVNAKLKEITANLQAKGIKLDKVHTPTTPSSAISTSLPTKISTNNSNDVADISSSVTSNTTTTSVIDTLKPKENPKGNVFKNIEINDLKNKYMLIRAPFLEKLQEETKTEIITRGKYYSDKSKATTAEPPLYLHVTAENQEILDQACKKIQDIIDMQPATLPSYNNGGGINPNHNNAHAGLGYHNKPGLGQNNNKRYVQDKVFIGIDDRAFNTKQKLIGMNGANVKHINHVTGARLQLRGRGSGFIEPTSGQEAFEPMFFQISSINEEGLEKAKQLVDDLIKTVKAEYERFKQYRTTHPNFQQKPHYNMYRPPASNMPVIQGGVQPPNPYGMNPYAAPPGMMNTPPAYGAAATSTYNPYAGYYASVATPPLPTQGTDSTSSTNASTTTATNTTKASSTSATATASASNSTTQPPLPPYPSTTAIGTATQNPSTTTSTAAPPPPSISYYPPPPLTTTPTASSASPYASYYNMYQPYYGYYQPPPPPPSTPPTSNGTTPPPHTSTPYKPGQTETTTSAPTSSSSTPTGK